MNVKRRTTSIQPEIRREIRPGAQLEKEACQLLETDLEGGLNFVNFELCLGDPDSRLDSRFGS